MEAWSRHLQIPLEPKAAIDIINESSVARLLHPEGVFSVIIPADGKESFLMAATRYGLHLSHQTFIHTKPGSEPKRVLLAFKFSVDKCVTDDLTIELSRHVYSEEYIALTKEFYLNM